MSRTITIGRYYPTNSWLHRCSPVFKFVFCCFLFLSVWVVRDVWLFLVLVLEIILLGVLSRVPISVYVRMLKGSIFFLLCYNLINLLFGVSFLFLLWTNAKVIASLFISCLLLFTTRSMDLNRGLELLFFPLQKLHINTVYITFSITLVLRFFPLILETMEQLKKALTSAGCFIYHSSWKEKYLYVKKILVPLFYLSFRKSDFFAELLEVKLFDLEATRTPYHQFLWRNKDILLLMIQVCLFVFCLL